jgi:hypothetical protein
MGGSDLCDWILMRVEIAIVYSQAHTISACLLRLYCPPGHCSREATARLTYLTTT